MEKKTYEELVEEVARLKRSCASYKSENTKLREKLDGMCKRNTELLLEKSALKAAFDSFVKQHDELVDQVVANNNRSWWERFKDLFWFD